MRRSPVVVMAIAPFVALAVACSGDGGAAVTPTATSTTTPVETRTPLPVPGAFYGTAGGISGRLIEGTRCWANNCIDMVGPLTLPGPVALPAAEPLDLLFEGGQPGEVSFAWVDVANVTPELIGSGTAAWVVPVDDFTPGQDIVTPDEPGQYVLTVHADWTGAGDVTFSGYFTVE